MKGPFSTFPYFPILCVLTLASDKVVLYENVEFPNVVLSRQKQYFRFSKKVLVFQKTYFKVKVLKTFKIFSGSLQWLSEVVRRNN